MKKLFAIIALVAFVGINSYAQTASTDKKEPKKEEVKKCTEAEKAACEKSGVKCETTDAKMTDAKTEKSCAKGAGGSCCSKGTTSAGSSCCQKGGATGGTSEAAPADKKKGKNKTVAMVTTPEKK